MCYIYVYLDTRKGGSYIYGDYTFDYEPFYVGKGMGDRYLTHLRIANGSRKGKNNFVIAKIRSILNDGYEPLILKIVDNLTKENYNLLEKSIIKLIGKSVDGNGPLLNISDGGDGGITWVDDHHNKGKRLEDIVGENKALEIKRNLSEQASRRIGELNPNYMNRGELNPLFGKERGKETIEKIREKTIEQFSKYSDDEISHMVNRMNIARENFPDEIKQEWYDKISLVMKNKYNNGELFSEGHRQKLKNNHFKKNNKGSDLIKTSEETKKKISESLKGRILTIEHRDKLRKCISFDEFEVIIFNLINNGIIKTITAYRKYAKENPDLKYPIRPEKSYKNYGWTDWRKYGL